MYMTKKVIKFFETEATLRYNCIIESNQKGSLENRAENLKEIMLSLADEEATPWLSFSLVTILLDYINWEAIVRHFEGLTATMKEEIEVEITELEL